MKSKIVIEVQMHCDKCWSKAMKIAASTDGVESVALQGDDRKRLVVTGDGVDSVNLTKTLRKKIGGAVIVEQGEVKKKEEEKKKVEENKIQWWPQPVLVDVNRLRRSIHKLGMTSFLWSNGKLGMALIHHLIPIYKVSEFLGAQVVTDALAQAGLESSNLIVGIDFTKSNEWTGKNSFQRRCLHALGSTSNPYEQAISIIGRSLAKFDDDNLIPCFGFGDASTHDQEVFSFYADHRPCDGYEEALQRYRDLVPNLRLAGPTSFAPIIETAIGIVDNSGGQYHVLLIIADGQVTRSVDMEPGQLSPQERDTINAIVKASEYPLSIVLVGVGDGPWDTMKQFDDNIPSRKFDNFKFGNFTEIMLRNTPASKKEAEFALAALMEIPSQYKATMDLQLLGKRKGVPERFYLPPPIRNQSQTYASPKPSPGGSYQYTNATNYKSNDASPSSGQSDDRQDCPICWAEAKNLAFGCGHQTCAECGKELRVCPICQRPITTRIKLY